MSMYTTGEMAKRCGVSVRTVQYYDNRKILVPSQLSEGGRRLYSEDDLHKMKIICFLREMDLSINTIGQLLSEEHPEQVIGLLLDEQEKVLREELTQRQEQIDKITGLRRAMKSVEKFSLESIGDIAHIMENRKQLRRVRRNLLCVAIPYGVLQWGSLIFWLSSGVFWPFGIYLLMVIPFVWWMFGYYWKEISYICPVCHQVFKPSKKEMFWARHTLTTRKLTCTCCGHKGFCVETYGGTLSQGERTE